MTGYLKLRVTPGDSRFPSLQQGFNRRWFAGNCEAVYICFDTPGATAALNDAITLYGKNVKFKSGGHCYENFVCNPGTKAIIDVSAMAGYGYDPNKGYYLESGGTNWSAFNALFRDYGKVLPAGSCYSVGLGGHICGGGYGLLSRLNGLTVDWLTGVDVVVKDSASNPARAIYVSADSTAQDQKDLYWAHRGGGGGNFGLITRYYFKYLPDTPATATITSMSISWDGLTTATLSSLLAWMADFSSRTDNWRQFAIVGLFHKGHGQISITIQTAIMPGENAAEVKAAYVDPLLDEIGKFTSFDVLTIASPRHLGGFTQPSAHTIDYTFYEAVQTLNGSGANQRGKYKSAYMRKPFPEKQITTIFEQLQIVPSGLTLQDMSQCLLQVDSYGGRVNTVPPADTPIYQRSSIMKLQYQAYWTEEANDQAYLSWMHKFYEEVYKDTGGIPNPAADPTNNVDGCYYNYPDSDLNQYGGLEGALKLYFGPNLNKLKQVKKRWDPNNYFNSFQSIPPAT